MSADIFRFSAAAFIHFNAALPPPPPPPLFHMRTRRMATEFSLCQTCHSQQRHGHLSTHLFLRLPRHLPQLVRRTSECSRPLLPLLFPQLTVDVYVP